MFVVERYLMLSQFCRYTLLLALIVGAVSCSDDDNPVGPTDPLPEVNGWQLQESPTADVWLFSVQFVDRRSGWIVGDSGVILHTTDGGQVWHLQRSGTDDRLVDMHFANRYEGWVIGERGTILHTDDGGASWHRQSSGTTGELQSITFIDDKIGWVTVKGGGRLWQILRTEDGGQTWAVWDTGGLALLKLMFRDASVGRGVTWSGEIISTENGGETWGIMSVIDVNLVLDMIFFDDSSGLILCVDYGKRDDANTYDWHDVMFETKDGGNTWEMIYRKHGSSFWGKLFMDNRTAGWLVSYWGFIQHTTDSGQTWQRQYYDLGRSLTDAYFLNSKVGWAVGQNGTILHTTNGGL